MRERRASTRSSRQYVTLKQRRRRPSKGLCPFHDEKSPSFHVTPARQFFHCFGCGEGGDVITFLMKIDGLGFTEAVESSPTSTASSCATRGRRPGSPRRNRGPQRGRLVEANKLAQEYYADHARHARTRWPARQFLAERGFDKDAAETFGLGFAPRDGDALLQAPAPEGLHRRGAGRRRAGRPSGRAGHYDRFRGRLLWPIRDVSGDVIGFGARRIFDDDRIEAKYLNTPETPIYKKRQVLYGIDLARREIARAVAGGRRRGLHRRDGLPPRRASAPRSPPAAPRSARTTAGCCAASCTTTRSSAAR